MHLKVVYIIEKKHSRVGVGNLKPMQDQNANWALFSPNDSRIPRMMIPMHECPANFLQRPQDFEKMIYIARIVNWDEYSKFAKGFRTSFLFYQSKEQSFLKYIFDDTVGLCVNLWVKLGKLNQKLKEF